MAKTLMQVAFDQVTEALATNTDALTTLKAIEKSMLVTRWLGFQMAEQVGVRMSEYYGEVTEFERLPIDEQYRVLQDMEDDLL